MLSSTLADRPMLLLSVAVLSTTCFEFLLLDNVLGGALDDRGGGTEARPSKQEEEEEL